MAHTGDKKKPEELSEVLVGLERAPLRFPEFTSNNPGDEVAHSRYHCSKVWTRLQEAPGGDPRSSLKLSRPRGHGSEALGAWNKCPSAPSSPLQLLRKA